MFHLEIWPDASWMFTNHCLRSFWSLKQSNRNNNKSDFPTFVWLILEHSSSTSEPPPLSLTSEKKKMVGKIFVNTLYGKRNHLLFWAGLFSSCRTLSSCLSHWLFFISKQQAMFSLLMSGKKRLLQFGPTDVFGRVWKVALKFDSIQDWLLHSGRKIHSANADCRQGFSI